MNAENGCSEAFAQFLEFEDAFGPNFKLTIAAMSHLERVVSGPGGPKIIEGLIADTGEPWRRNQAWKDPSAYLRRAIGDTSLMGVVQVHSAIDDFVVSLQADLSRWEMVRGGKSPASGMENSLVESDIERLEATCVRLGWSTATFAAWRPLLKFFRVLRNCAAHRSGVATQALVDLRDSSEFAQALDSWQKRPGAAPPPLPKFKAAESIRIAPRHAVLCQDAAHRACDYLNQCATRTLGAEGLVQMAAYHTLLAKNPRRRTNAYRNAESVVTHALTERYRVQGANGLEVTSVLKQIGAWTGCRKRHTELYGSPARPRRPEISG